MKPDANEPWPHQFTKNGKGYELLDGSHAQTYVCVHCYKEFIKGFESPPPNPCPARSTKREMIRLKNGG